MAERTDILPCGMPTSTLSNATSAALILRSQIAFGACRVLGNVKIDQRTEGFDQIVGEVEGILFAGMEESDGRMQTMSHQSPGDGAAQDGITVIEGGIGPALFGAVKAGAE